MKRKQFTEREREFADLHHQAQADFYAAIENLHACVTRRGATVAEVTEAFDLLVYRFQAIE